MKPEDIKVGTTYATPFDVWTMEDIKVGATYATRVAAWTVESISAGTAPWVFVRREDGRSAKYYLADFARWVVREIPK